MIVGIGAGVGLACIIGLSYYFFVTKSKRVKSQQRIRISARQLSGLNNNDPNSTTGNHIRVEASSVASHSLTPNQTMRGANGAIAVAPHSPQSGNGGASVDVVFNNANSNSRRGTVDNGLEPVANVNDEIDKVQKQLNEAIIKHIKYIQTMLLLILTTNMH